MEESSCNPPVLQIAVTINGVPYPFISVQLSDLINRSMNPPDALKYELEVNEVLKLGYEDGGMPELERRHAHYVGRLSSLLKQRQAEQKKLRAAEFTGVVIKTAAGTIAAIAPAILSGRLH